MNTLSKTFNFEDSVVRTSGTFENPMFCVKDVCAMLGVKNHMNKISLLDQDERDEMHMLDAIGRYQKTTFCTEAGLYRIIFSVRRNPKTEPIKRWVFHEVLPSIRKTGRYENEELMRQVAILKDTAKTQHNMIEALSKENRKYNITQVLETDRACIQALTPQIANSFAKSFGRDRGWKTNDLYDNVQRQQLISEFRKRIIYDCVKHSVRFVNTNKPCQLFS